MEKNLIGDKTSITNQFLLLTGLGKLMKPLL